MSAVNLSAQLNGADNTAQVRSQEALRALFWGYIPIPLNLFPPQSYVRRVITNKTFAGIVILYLTSLCSYCFSDKLPRASLKGLHAVLLILTRE